MEIPAKNDFPSDEDVDREIKALEKDIKRDSFKFATLMRRIENTNDSVERARLNAALDEVETRLLKKRQT